jgi:NADPH:quinone reductase-like Zn-dependent oxidoreductase
MVEGPALGSPGPGEVNIKVEAGPINPAELLLIEGKYASRPPLPARLGIEGVGTITAVGEGVNELAMGDRVMSLGRTNWAEEIQVSSGAVVKVPKDADVQQLSMLKVNPATAMFMLERYVNLKPGDWVIQNAANSAVGRYIIQLAKTKGVKTLNVVRRTELFGELRKIGADVVLLDGDDLAKRVRSEVGDANIPLAIDAVAGEGTLRLGGALSEGGTVVNYGLLSGKPCQLTPELVVFQGITLTGFWLAKLLGTMKPDELQKLYAELASQITNGNLYTPVESAYRLDQLSDALKHAYQTERNGKVLLMPNG